MLAMGHIKMEILGTANHGCDRAAQPGDQLKRCTAADCFDCRALDFVDAMRASGAINIAGTECAAIHNGEKVYDHATLTHWPFDDNGGIADDLVSGTRKRGAFQPAPATNPG